MVYFGEVISEEVHHSAPGKLANEYWEMIPEQFSFAKLDEYIVMPNHVHGIIEIDKSCNSRDAANSGDLSISGDLSDSGDLSNSGDAWWQMDIYDYADGEKQNSEFIKAPAPDCIGFEQEIGLIYKKDRLIFNLGMTTVNYQYVDFVLGFGYLIEK